MKMTPLAEFIDLATQEKYLWLSDKPDMEELGNMILEAKKKEIDAMKSFFIQGFMTGSGAYQLKVEIDIDAEFEKFFKRWFQE
jgi:hypothetical protein